MDATDSAGEEAAKAIEQPTGVLEQSAEVIEQSAMLVDQLSGYGFLILNSFYMLSVGMLLIFVVHRLTARFLYPHLNNALFVRILFGALYVLVLVVCVLLVLRELGFDVEAIGRLSILAVLVGAVLVFFLAPFLPRLPFLLGHLIEVNGVLGNVETISSFHTTIRRFDGTVAFIPNALLMASRISNYSITPQRRIEIHLSVDNDSDLDKTLELFLKLMADDERVLDEPAPPSAFVVSATASGVNMTSFCWVANADWFRTRSDLWLKIVRAFRDDERVSMSLPQQEVYVMDGDKSGS